MLVRLKVQTRFNGPKCAGTELKVSDEVGSNWIKKGIAELVYSVEVVKEVVGNQDEEQEEQEEINEDAVQEVVAEEPVHPEPIDIIIPAYETRTAKELFALCKERGIEVESKQPKEVYVEALNNALFE